MINVSNTTTIILAVIYFIVILAVGYVAGKKTKGMDDFMVGGRNLGPWITSLGIMAAVMSGWTWLGNPGLSYQYGYAGYVRNNGLAAIGLVIGYFMLAKPVRIISEKHNCYTLPDILALRFNNNKFVRTLTSFIILLACFTYLVSQWTSMGTVMQYVLGCDYKLAVIAGAIIISAYVIAGGMLASMWTNFAQMIIMFVCAIILLAVTFKACGGFTEMNLAAAAINPDMVAPYFKEGSFNATYIFSYAICATLFAYGGQPSVNTKFMMISSKKDLKWSCLIATVALVVGVSTFLAGIGGYVLIDQGKMPALTGSADTILPMMIQHLFGDFVGAAIMVAVMAAVMSTAETYLFQSATTVTRDLMVQVFGVKWDDKTTLKWSRVAMVIVAVITVFVALNPIDLIGMIGAQAFGCFCAGFGAITYLSIRWKRVNTKAAIGGLLVGLIFGGIIPFFESFALGHTIIPDWTTAGIGVIASFVVTIVITLCTPREPDSIIFKK